VGGIEGRETDERASLGNEHLILSQMASGSVVLAVCNTPGMVWNSKTDGELRQSDVRINAGEDTYPEWRIQPTALLTNLDSE
jgi:hypothetical protein